MHQTPRSGLAAERQRDTAAFADERNRYLRHCSDHGASPTTLKLKRNELLWISQHLDSRASHGVGMEALLPIAQKREKLNGATTAAQRVVDIGRPWLRFLGWWREPAVTFQYQCELDRYVTWMRDERGFTPSTVEQWARIARRFLRWCEQANHELAALQIGDIDEYFAIQGTERWSRVCVANTASALRGFLRHAAMQGICANGLAAAICRPRLYRQDAPYARTIPTCVECWRMPRINHETSVIAHLTVACRLRAAVVKSQHCASSRSVGRPHDSYFPSEASTASGLPSASFRRRSTGRLHRHGASVVILRGSLPLYAGAASTVEGREYLRCRESQVCRTRNQSRPPRRTRLTSCVRGAAPRGWTDAQGDW